jgi:hypothetical protein
LQKKKKKAVAIDLEDVATPDSETPAPAKSSNVDALGNTKADETPADAEGLALLQSLDLDVVY